MDKYRALISRHTVIMPVRNKNGDKFKAHLVTKGSLNLWSLWYFET